MHGQENIPDLIQLLKEGDLRTWKLADHERNKTVKERYEQP